MNLVINSEKLIDLHTHTTYSDGDLTPDELVKLAIQKNIGTLALTDHYTVNGLKALDRNNPLIIDSKINIINGIELSGHVPVGSMHILGYGIDIENKILNKKLTELKDNSINHTLSIMEQIKRDYKILFSYEDIKALVNANHNLGRPDIARLCIKYGYASTVQEAFDKYLASAFDKTRGMNKRLTYEESIDTILNSNGIPVLAHPKSLKLDEKEFITILEKLISYGLQGIEVYHSSHSKEEMEYYLQIAHKYNLLVSGGTDYHGVSVKPNIELGSGINNNIKIKQLSILDELAKKHDK